ncbi:MAG: hypothetical protein P1U37_03030 [Minwuia sp.]|nr:hypothetical protein [Minwuia sp.]
MSSLEVQTNRDEKSDAYRLATAEIVYHMPDQPHHLQTFVWQTLDLAPDFPRVMQFISTWRDEIKANLHSVRISSGDTVTPVVINRAKFGVSLH